MKWLLATLGFALILLSAAPAPSAQIYWTNVVARKIQRANLDGTGIEDIVTTGLDEPQGIALDLTMEKVYWTDSETNRIQRANLDGSDVENILTTGLTQPLGITLDLAAGKMYWVERGTSIISTDGRVRRANLDGTNVENLVATGLFDPRFIALDPAGGKMYWTDNRAQNIKRANLDGSVIQTLITGTPRPDMYSGIDVDTAGGRIYFTDFGEDVIQRAPLTGGVTEDLISVGLGAPIDIALDVLGGKMYFTEASAFDGVKRANLDGGGVEDVLMGVDGITALALDLRIVPEPDSVTLAGLGLAVLLCGVLWRRRKRIRSRQPS